MKKLSIYLGIIVALFGLLYYLDYASNQKVNGSLESAAQRLYNTTPDNLSKSTRDQLNNEDYQAIILPDDLKQRLADKESLIVYMFSPECVHCQDTTPTLNDIAKDVNVDYKQLNVFEFRDQWDLYRVTATPTLIYFKDGVEAARIEGSIVGKEAEYRAFLEAADV